MGFSFRLRLLSPTPTATHFFESSGLAAIVSRRMAPLRCLGPIHKVRSRRPSAGPASGELAPGLRNIPQQFQASPGTNVRVKGALPMSTVVLRNLPLDWESLEDSMDRPRDWPHHNLLDVETGQVFFLHDGVVRYVRDGGPTWLAPWQEEDVPLARRILADETGRYVPIPVPSNDENYRAMRDFIRHPAVSEDLGRELLEALMGPGAFRRFRAVLARAPRVRKHWNEFEQAWQRWWLDRWLRSLGIDPGSDESDRSGV